MFSMYNRKSRSQSDFHFFWNRDDIFEKRETFSGKSFEMFRTILLCFPLEMKVTFRREFCSIE